MTRSWLLLLLLTLVACGKDAPEPQKPVVRSKLSAYCKPVTSAIQVLKDEKGKEYYISIGVWVVEGPGEHPQFNSTCSSIETYDG